MSAAFIGKSVGHFLTIGGVVFLFALAAAVTPAAFAQNKAEASTEVKASCNLAGKAKVNVFAGGAVSTSPTYADIPGTEITKIKLKKDGCIIVQFSAEANSGANDYLYIRVMRDGSTQCRPFEVILNTTPTPAGAAARAMNFVCKNVTAGTHSVKVQFKRVGSTGNAFISERTTIAQY